MSLTSPTRDDDMLTAYDYASDPRLQAHLHAADRDALRRILSYGRAVNQYGRRLMAHQMRVARYGALLMEHLGYSAQAAYNFKAAMMFHDIGKIDALYAPAVWTLEDRPTPAQKSLQKRHPRLGADLLAADADRTGLRDHPHIAVRHAVTLYHHERIDGTGPEKVAAATLPRFVRISCIVDAYDGDRILRPHQSHRRTPLETITRMQAQNDSPDHKYKGAFDEELLDAFRTLILRDG